MKKSIVTIIITLIFAVTSKAQDVAFKIGYTYSDVIASPEPFNLFTEKQTFHAGLSIKNIKITSKIGLQPELLFSKQGFSLASIGNVSLHYFAMPILFTFPITENFHLQVGPQVSYLVNSKIGIANDLFSLSYKGIFQDFDAGAVAGLEYQVSKNVAFGARYYLGMTDVNKSFDLGKNISSNQYFNLKNTNAQFFVSFNFGK